MTKQTKKPFQKVLHVALGEHNKTLYKATAALGEQYKQVDWTKNPEGINDEIVRLCQTWNPDLAFFQIQREGIIKPYALQAIKGYKVNWTGDVRFPVPNHYVALSPYFDLTLFSNKTDVEIIKNGYGKENIDYLQVGFEEEIYMKTGAKIPSPDVVFMGNNYLSTHPFPLSAQRVEMVRQLQNTFGEKFGVYGVNWGVTENLNAEPQAEASVYRNCKIAINQNHFNYRNFSSDRLSRILACGAFCISNHFEGIEEEYKIGKHLVTWKTLEELKEKIVYYLKNDAERIKIAQAGHDLMWKKGTWGYRMKQLQKLIKLHPMKVVQTEDKEVSLPEIPNEPREVAIPMSKGVDEVLPNNIPIQQTDMKIHQISDAWVSKIPNLTPQKIYSQFGEETIIDFIFKNIGTTNKFFVDFGAGDGKTLSNTRYLLEKGWKGLMMDGNNQGNEMVMQHHITAENINQLFDHYNVPKIFDLWSLDIDSNEYHIWKILECEPRVIVVEFNGTLGVNECKTIKYNPNHVFQNNAFYGASFQALKKLGAERGYSLIHQLATTNMFFVKSDLLGGYKEYGITYTPCQYWAYAPNAQWVEV